MKVHTLVQITPHHSGFGMYQVGELQVSPTNSYAAFDDLISECNNNLYAVASINLALGDPLFIENGIEDIRGKIYNQPSNVYAFIDDFKTLGYFGVVESDVPENFFE
jgi:hypothetical protein